MEFPKIGDKYRNNLSGMYGEIIKVYPNARSVKYKSSNDIVGYLPWSIVGSDYTKISPEIELGSRWLLPNGRLITVSSKNHEKINYYFGEAYCFTKVRFSKYESTFLSDCSPFTGNLDDYDNTGIKREPTCIMGDYYFTIPVAAGGDQLAPICTSVLTDVGGQFPIYADHQYCGEPITKPPTNIKKETNIEQEIFDTMFQNHMEDVSNEFIYGSDFKNWSNLKKYMAKLEDTNVLIVCGSQKQAGERRKEFSVDNEENVYGSHNFMMRNVVQVVSREYEGTCFKADLVIFDDCDNLDQNTKNNRLERLRFSENPRYEVWEQDSQVSITGMMFSSKKPLWKRILKKLV